METVDVLFVCLHGSAKSVVAAELFRREAAARGLVVTSASAGIEVDTAIPSGVIDGLAAEGIDVAGLRPTPLTGAMVVSARHVVSFGCRLDHIRQLPADVRQWEDLPAFSDGYGPARAAIATRDVGAPR